MRHNQLTCAVCAISQFGGDLEFPLIAFLHELQSLHPTGNNLRHAEHSRFFPFIRAVKHHAVDQSTLIMTLHPVVLARLPAMSFFYHLILQSARQDYDSRLLLVSFQEDFAVFLIFLDCFILKLCKEFIYNLITSPR